MHHVHIKHVRFGTAVPDEEYPVHSLQLHHLGFVQLDQVQEMGDASKMARAHLRSSQADEPLK